VPDGDELGPIPAMEELDPGWRSPTLGEIDPAGHGRARTLSPPALEERASMTAHAR